MTLTNALLQPWNFQLDYFKPVITKPPGQKGGALKKRSERRSEHTYTFDMYLLILSNQPSIRIRI